MKRVLIKSTMPIYFKTSDDSFVIYMGIDRHENALLAEFGWNEDILFHCDKVSSAHVYLRTKKKIDQKLFKKISKKSDFRKYFGISETVIDECLLLTKANSRDAKQSKRAKIIATPWTNIRPVARMAPGTIQFNDLLLIKSFPIIKSPQHSTLLNKIETTKFKKKLKKPTQFTKEYFNQTIVEAMNNVENNETKPNDTKNIKIGKRSDKNDKNDQNGGGSLTNQMENGKIEHNTCNRRRPISNKLEVKLAPLCISDISSLDWFRAKQTNALLCWQLYSWNRLVPTFFCNCRRAPVTSSCKFATCSFGIPLRYLTTKLRLAMHVL